MDLFVCATAYQLVNAIAIVKQENSEADIVFTHSNMSSVCDADALRSLGIFRNIYCWYELTDAVTENGIKTGSDGFAGKLKKLFAYSARKAVYRSIPNRDETYDRVFIGYDEIPSEYIFFWFNKKGASLHLYDEGTYTYKCLEIAPSVFKRILSQILFRAQMLDKCQCLWVRSPEDVAVGAGKNIEIKKIVTAFGDISDIIGTVFYGTFDPEQFRAPVIFLDQYFSDKAYADLQKKVVSMITGRYGRESVAVKLHPSTGDSGYGPDIITIKTKIPFELFAGSIDIENKIIIAIYSTACFTPKQVFDKEPTVIFLYKLVNADSGGIINKNFFDGSAGLKKKYSASEKVIVAEDLEDITATLDAHLKRLDA